MVKMEGCWLRETVVQGRLQMVGLSLAHRWGSFPELTCLALHLPCQFTRMFLPLAPGSALPRFPLSTALLTSALHPIWLRHLAWLLT